MQITVLKHRNKISFFSKIKRYKNQIFLCLFLFVISVFFIINSSKYSSILIDGILLYGTKILPGLFPFFFITKIMSSFDILFSFCGHFKFLTKLLFNTPAISFYIFFMSIISGYPMGAKLTTEFYEKGLITKTDAEKILSFCSTSGPMFVIGTVGAGFLKSTTLGLLIFAVHIISSIINGIIFSRIKNKNIETENKAIISPKKTQINTNTLSLEEIMYSTIKSVLIVGGYIVLFYVLIEVLLDLNIFYPLIKLLTLLGLNNLEAMGIISGIVEITKGLSILNNSQNIKLVFILTNGLISFSGISILIQSLKLLNKIKINKKLFLLQKITHSIISSAISYLISFIIF